MTNVQENINYKVNGYKNTWNVISTYRTLKTYALLENTVYGDEACALLVEMENNVEDVEYTRNGETVVIPTIQKVICSTYDDIITTLIDEDII